MPIKGKLLGILGIALLLLIITTEYSCAFKDKKYNTPKQYNLNSPYTIKLPPDLNEISGLAYYEKDKSIFAESDAKGYIYKIIPGKHVSITEWKFAHKSDYEDIVLHDSTFYVLNSNGDIVVVNFVNSSPVAKEYHFPNGVFNEFESVYYDNTAQKLRLVCKNYKTEESNTLQTFVFDIQQGSYAESYAINTKPIADEENDKHFRFKPSGAAVNPIDNNLYLLSSIDKMMVVADQAGNIKEVYHLNPQIFVHPEGITFTSAGDLFISNEAEKFTPASLLYFKYKKQ